MNTQQQDEQVWMPPLTAITGNGDPNGNPGDETLFIAMATTANSEKKLSSNGRCGGAGEGFCLRA